MWVNIPDMDPYGTSWWFQPSWKICSSNWIISPRPGLKIEKYVSFHHSGYTSIAARGGGGSFKKLKLYNSEEHLPIESFVTTLIHWTFFSDDANKVGICWLCRSGQLHVTPTSRWSLPRCHRSVRNDMRLFLRTKQYPVQLRTTKFWKVLPPYFSVLQSTTPDSTTPVLLRTTKYSFVLQSTSPVLLRTTKYYSSTTEYYKRTTKY